MSERLRLFARRLAERAGWQVVERRFYSPVPDLDALPADVFARRSELAGVELDVDAQAAFAESELGPFLAEFGDGPAGWTPRNGYYDRGDAGIAYAVIRPLRPARVVELGSGFSSLVIDHALDEGAEHTVYDPYPSPLVPDARPLPAQEVPLEAIDALAAGDVLFVDTSHTVKLGGDVNRVVLELLPRLAPGVWVHFHDIWLPGEYHEVLVRQMEMYWAEQYLLQAFLAFNADFEVTFATRAVADARPELLPRLIPGLDATLWPSSFWIRRKP